MKKVALLVTINFFDEIENIEDAQKVANNVCDAIISHANTTGIAPEYTITSGVVVTEVMSQYQIQRATH